MVELIIGSFKWLKELPLDITAVVAVSDDDSSTGRLRREFNIPALGDLRNVMISLSDAAPILKSYYNIVLVRPAI